MTHPKRYCVFVAWTVALSVPILVQLLLLRTRFFSTEFAPAMFVAACVIYLFAWRHFCRRAFCYDDIGDASIRPKHPTLARMSVLAFVAVFMSAALFLGLSAVTKTGPYDYPVIWLLFLIVFLCYKEIIVAFALTIARATDDARHAMQRRTGGPFFRNGPSTPGSR